MFMRITTRNIVGGWGLLIILSCLSGCQMLSGTHRSTPRPSGQSVPTIDQDSNGRSKQTKKPSELDEAPAFRGQAPIGRTSMPQPMLANDFSSPDLYNVDNRVDQTVSQPPQPTPIQAVSETPFPFAGQSAPQHSQSGLVVQHDQPITSIAPVSAPPAIDDPWAALWATNATPAIGEQSQIPPASHDNRAMTVAPLSVASPAPFAQPFEDPFLGGREAVSIDAAAKREAEEEKRHREEQDKKQLEQIASIDKKHDYLQDLPPWSGPFSDREKKKNIEQEIIRQVSHVDYTPPKSDTSPLLDWEKEDEKGFDWSVLDPVNFFTKMRDLAGMGPDEQKATASMSKGRELLLESENLKNRSKNLAAAKHFKEASWRWPESVMEEDALHLAAECYFFSDDYPRAMKMYQKLIIKYQHSKYLDNAVRRLFSIGQYWEAEDRRGVAFVNMSEKSRPTYDTFGFCQKAYESIFINDPNGPKSDDAVMALACAHLAKGKLRGDTHYERAAYYFAYLRENYPLSKHIAKAHEFELVARTNAYQGASYNGKTLDEAGKLADSTLRIFSGEMDHEEKEEVLALKEELIHRQAEREWTLGQYYDKKRYYRSAVLYYEKLLDQYPQTSFADKARVRIEEIKDKPAEPGQLDFIKKLYMPRGSF